MVALGAHVHVRGPVRAVEHDHDSDTDLYVSWHWPHHERGPVPVPTPGAAVADHHDFANLHDTDRTIEYAADRIGHALVTRLHMRAPVFRAAVEHDHRNARVRGRADRQPIAVLIERHHRHNDAHVGLSIAGRAGHLHRQHHHSKPMRARVRPSHARDANAVHERAAIRRMSRGDDGRRTHVPTRRLAHLDVCGADRFCHVGRMVDHGDAVQ